MLSCKREHHFEGAGRQKTNKKQSKKQYQKRSGESMRFYRFWDPFWLHFGLQKRAKKRCEKRGEKNLENKPISTLNGKREKIIQDARTNMRIMMSFSIKNTKKRIMVGYARICQDMLGYSRICWIL